MSFIDGVKLWLARSVAEVVLAVVVLALILGVGFAVEWRKSRKGGSR